MQRRSPQARYGVGLGFLILMALAPVLTFLLLRGEAAPVVATAGSVIALPSGASGVASHEWKANLDASLPIVLLVWGIGVTLLSARFAGDFSTFSASPPPAWNPRRRNGTSSSRGCPGRWAFAAPCGCCVPSGWKRPWWWGGCAR